MASLFENYAPLDESHAQFYLADILLAIESIHNLKYFHRNLEPETILIDNKVIYNNDTIIGPYKISRFWAYTAWNRTKIKRGE